MNPEQFILKSAQDYVTVHLRECAQELLELQDTTFLGLGYIRTVEDMLRPLRIGSVHSLACSLVRDATVKYAALNA